MKQNNCETKILDAVELANQEQKRSLIPKIQKLVPELNGKTIAVWGLAFKPNTDDMREAPSLVVIENLLRAGAKVKAYDPVSMNEAKRILGDKIEFAQEQYEVLKDIEGLFIITEWPEFKFPDFKKVKNLMKKHVIFDGRNVYDPNEMKALGFDYFGIGTKQR